jgi:hypothetical protein
MKFRRFGAGVFLLFTLLSVGSLLAVAVVQPSHASAATPPEPSFSVSSSFIDQSHILVTATGNYQGANLATVSGIYYDGEVEETTYNGTNTNPTFHYVQGGPKGYNVTDSKCVSSLDVNEPNVDGTEAGNMPVLASMSINYQFHIDPAGTGGTNCINYSYTDNSLTNSLLLFSSTFTIGDTSYNSSNNLDTNRGATTYGAGVGQVSTPYMDMVTFYEESSTTLGSVQGDPTFDDQEQAATFQSQTVGFAPSGTTDYFMSGGQQKGSVDIVAPGCPDFIALSTDDPADSGGVVERATYYTQVTDSDGSCENQQAQPHNSENDPSWYVLMLVNSPANTATGTTNGTGSTGGDNPVVPDNCPIPTWGLRWIACPIVDSAETLIAAMQKEVEEWLIIDINGTFNTSKSATAKDFYSAWNTFRIIALAVIVLAGLVMVISEALGLDLVTAYAAKKMAPKLTGFTILILISWPLMKDGAQIANNLTAWVGDAVTYPFRGLAGTANGVKISATGDFTTVFAQYAGIGAAVAFLGAAGILSFMGTAAGAIIFLFGVLLVRRVILDGTYIAMALILALRAIPATEKFGKIGTDEYLALQFGVALILAASNGLGIDVDLISIASGGDWGSALGFILLVLVTFAGGLLAVRAGSTTGKVLGLYNGGHGKKKRAAIREKNAHDLKTGNRFAGTKFIPGSTTAANLANRVSAGAASGVGGSFGLPTARGRAAYAQTQDIEAEKIRNSEPFHRIKDHPGALRAGTYRDSRSAIRGMSNEYFRQNMQSGGFANTEEGRADARNDAARKARSDNAAFEATKLKRGAAMQSAAARGMTDEGTAFFDMRDQVETGARVGVNNEGLSSLAGYQNSKKDKRPDLTPGHGNLAGAMQRVKTMGRGSIDQFGYDSMFVHASRNSGSPSQMSATAKGQFYQQQERVNNRMRLAAAGGLPGYGGTQAQRSHTATELTRGMIELGEASYANSSADNVQRLENMTQTRLAQVQRLGGNPNPSNGTRVYRPNTPP